jgi:hypothetical protein
VAFSFFVYSQSEDHPEENLAKSGNEPDMKVFTM